MYYCPKHNIYYCLSYEAHEIIATINHCVGIQQRVSLWYKKWFESEQDVERPGEG